MRDYNRIFDNDGNSIESKDQYFDIKPVKYVKKSVTSDSYYPIHYSSALIVFEDIDNAYDESYPLHSMHNNGSGFARTKRIKSAFDFVSRKKSPDAVADADAILPPTSDSIQSVTYRNTSTEPILFDEICNMDIRDYSESASVNHDIISDYSFSNNQIEDNGIGNTVNDNNVADEELSLMSFSSHSYNRPEEVFVNDINDLLYGGYSDYSIDSISKNVVDDSIDMTSGITYNTSVFENVKHNSSSKDSLITGDDTDVQFSLHSDTEAASYDNSVESVSEGKDIESVSERIDDEPVIFMEIDNTSFSVDRDINSIVPEDDFGITGEAADDLYASYSDKETELYEQLERSVPGEKGAEPVFEQILDESVEHSDFDNIVASTSGDFNTSISADDSVITGEAADDLHASYSDTETGSYEKSKKSVSGEKETEPVSEYIDDEPVVFTEIDNSSEQFAFADSVVDALGGFSDSGPEDDVVIFTDINNN